MITNLAIAIAAGCASALMLASYFSGSLIAVMLAGIAPLPLMVACLGWGPTVATIGGIVGATALGLQFGMPVLITFVLLVALPAWWLGHLALLGRTTVVDGYDANGLAVQTSVTEWYPIGRILLWITGFAIATTLVILLTLDSALDVEKLKTALRASVQLPDGAQLSDGMIHAVLTVMVMMFSMSLVTSLCMNLWFAARITAASGRLRRSMPDFRTTALPPMTVVATCVAVGLAFMSGEIGVAGKVATAALLTAYALTGLATIHVLTLGNSSRRLILVATYAFVMILGGLGWPLAFLSLLGIADSLLGLRTRYLGRHPALSIS